MQRHFKLAPSHYLAVILLCAHGLAFAALLPVGLPAWAKTGLAFCVLLNLQYQLRLKAWLSAPGACVGLLLEGKRVVLTMRDGNNLDGRLARDSLVTPHLAVLNVLPQGTRFARSVVILPDSLDAESFRQLRVWLRWGDASPGTSN